MADYWTKPIQGSRSAESYGNTRLYRDAAGIRWRVAGLVFGMTCGVAVYFMANAFGTALSPSVEPQSVSLASPHQSLSQGDTK